MLKMGSVYMGGLGVGFWTSLEEIFQLQLSYRSYGPSMETHEREHHYAGWKRAVATVLSNGTKTSVFYKRGATMKVWWSLANEYDLMWAKTPADWDRFALSLARKTIYRCPYDSSKMTDLTSQSAAGPPDWDFFIYLQDVLPYNVRKQ